jgi:BirA family transcriptional regulator, biotin operon repressor / biotin---[acetyl-CoA-carboxylase] ligase
LKNPPGGSRERLTKALDGKILRLFHERNGGIVSGEEASTLLKVTRTAVWKHIRSLREAGYHIEALPSRGYRLVRAPDLLIPEEIAAGLKTERIGSRIICLKEAGSTNEEAFRLAEEGAEEGAVVIAESQTRGKGRLGRQWESPPGVNLYCSVILRPPVLPVRAAQLTFLSSVAVARTIGSSTSLTPAIKWPNDVMVGGRKVAGLLNEMSAETDKINFFVLGIGVNINMKQEQFPEGLRHPATSLAMEEGSRVDRTAFTRALLEALDHLYSMFLENGYGPVREEWLGFCNSLDREVLVTFQDTGLRGTARGIDDEGALLVERTDGSIERVLAGDVTILSD